MLSKELLGELLLHTHLNSTYSKLNSVSSSLPNLLFLCTPRLHQWHHHSLWHPNQKWTHTLLTHLPTTFSPQALPIQPPKYPTHLIFFHLYCNCLDWGLIFFHDSCNSLLPYASFLGKTSWIRISSLGRGHANFLYPFPILIYVLLKWAPSCILLKLTKLNKLHGRSVTIWSHGHTFHKVCKIHLNQNWLKLLSLSTERSPLHIFSCIRWCWSCLKHFWDSAKWKFVWSIHLLWV